MLFHFALCQGPCVLVLSNAVNIKFLLIIFEVGWYSDSLQAGRTRDRIPVGARFCAPIQTGPGAYPASYTMGTGSFPGVKRPGLGVGHPPHLAPRLKKE